MFDSSLFSVFGTLAKSNRIREGEDGPKWFPEMKYDRREEGTKEKVDVKIVKSENWTKEVWKLAVTFLKLYAGK